MASSSADDHDHATDPFPRHETADLINRELAARTTRERYQPWLIALGITLVALAFPTHRLLGDVRDVIESTARGGLQGWQLVPSALALGLVRAGTSPEPSAYLLSAIFLGLSVVPLISLADERGWERAPAILVALLVTTSPIGWLAGTLPSSAAAQLCGACWFGASLARRNATVRLRLVAWCAACLLCTANVVLFPALVASLASDPARSQRAAKHGCITFAVLVLVATAGAMLVKGPTKFDDDVPHTPTVLPGFGAAMAEHLALLPALAIFALGVAMLFLSTRRPPLHSWPWLFAAGALAPFGPAVFGIAALPWISAAPIAALGWLEFLQRADERSRGALARLATAIALVAGIAGARWFDLRDPRRAWTDATAELLEPGDVVMSLSADHLYLLQNRFRVETRDLRPLARPSEYELRARLALERARASNRLRLAGRVVVDASAGPGWEHALHADSEAVRAIERELRDFARENGLPLLPIDPASGEVGK